MRSCKYITVGVRTVLKILQDLIFEKKTFEFLFMETLNIKKRIKNEQRFEDFIKILPCNGQKIEFLNFEFLPFWNYLLF